VVAGSLRRPFALATEPPSACSKIFRIGGRISAEKSAVMKPLRDMNDLDAEVFLNPLPNVSKKVAGCCTRSGGRFSRSSRIDGQ